MACCSTFLTLLAVVARLAGTSPVPGAAFQRVLLHALTLLRAASSEGPPGTGYSQIKRKLKGIVKSVIMHELFEIIHFCRMQLLQKKTKMFILLWANTSTFLWQCLLMWACKTEFTWFLYEVIHSAQARCGECKNQKCFETKLVKFLKEKYLDTVQDKRIHEKKKISSSHCFHLV